MRESFFARSFAALPRLFRRHKLIKWVIRLVPSSRISILRFNQTKFVVVDLTDSEARQALITGEFEPEFFAIAESFILPGSVMLDVGANQGFCTYGLIGMKISFHLFEANLHLCNLLQSSSRLYPLEDVKINNACVTDQPGFSRLRIDAEHLGESYISTEASGQKVANIVLDDYLRENQITEVSFLKLDIEGYEMHALRGLATSIREGRIGAMYIECSSENLRRQGEDIDSMFNYLRSLGCQLFWCKEQDFARGYAEHGKDVFPVAGKAAVRLAPVKKSPSDYMTDIIAVPANGMHASMLRGMGF